MLELGLAELAVLGLASYQDIKTREIDAWVVALLFPPALAAAYFSRGTPLYLMSPILGLILALAMRLTGSGYADSLTIIALSLFPPFSPVLPTPAVVVLGAGISILGTSIWLFLANRGKPCKMTLAQRLTHICIPREEALRRSHRYIIGEVKDLEKYKPPERIEGDYVLAKYGVPYVAHMALGFALYLALYWILTAPRPL
ncbi:MAG: prepilin peptidase [Thermoproteus sp.]|jgi:preflagellin peptidase FlaK